MPNLSFGHYELIDPNIIEIMADGGVELHLPEAQECLDVYSTLPPAIGVLVNRNNSYSSTYEFADIISGEPKIKAMAILVPTERSALIADTQKLMFEYPFQVFYDRKEAIQWLQKHLSIT